MSGRVSGRGRSAPPAARAAVPVWLRGCVEAWWGPPGVAGTGGRPPTDRSPHRPRTGEYSLSAPGTSKPCDRGGGRVARATFRCRAWGAALRRSWFQAVCMFLRAGAGTNMDRASSGASRGLAGEGGPGRRPTGARRGRGARGRAGARAGGGAGDCRAAATGWPRRPGVGRRARRAAGAARGGGRRATRRSCWETWAMIVCGAGQEAARPPKPAVIQPGRRPSGA